MPLILEISSDNRIISLEDKVLTVRQHDEIAAEIPLREVRAVFVTAQNTLFGQNLLQNLTDKNIPFVILDKNFSLISVLAPYSYTDGRGKVHIRQLEARSGLYKKIWQAIVTEKIKNRFKVLRSLHKKDKLQKLVNQVFIGDSRDINDKSEHLYFTEMFGAEFQRALQPFGINAFLQYGYMLLQVLALRYIWWQGLNPSLNFNPKQNQNYFGLAEDVTEAYKPLVEKLVYEIFTRDNLENNQPLTAEYKAELLHLLNKSYYDGKRLISLFELVRKTVAEASASLRQNKVRLAFSNYLIEVKEM